MFWCKKTTKYMKPSRDKPTAHTEHSDAKRLATEPVACRASLQRTARPNPFASNPSSTSTSRCSKLRQRGEIVIKNESTPHVTSTIHINPQCIWNISTNSYLISGRTATKDCGVVRNTTHHSTITHTHTHTW